MKPVKQKIFDKKKGDCFRACMASILELPNNGNLPHIASEDWLAQWMNFLDNFGMRLGMSTNAYWKQGYWIASVPSKNIKGVSHAVVMFGTKIAFDPSTHKRYRKGTRMLGKATFGWWIEISDMSKFKQFIKKYHE